MNRGFVQKLFRYLLACLKRKMQHTTSLMLTKSHLMAKIELLFVCELDIICL